MGFFTLMWAGWAYSSWQHWWILATTVFWCLAIWFQVSGIVTLRQARRLPHKPIEAGPDRSGRWFGAIFTAEGILICASCAVLGATGHFQFICPAVALVVGLHFIPLAKVFHRRIDVLLGAISAIAALATLWWVATDINHYPLPWGAIAYLMACITTVYGFVMRRSMPEKG